MTPLARQPETAQVDASKNTASALLMTVFSAEAPANDCETGRPSLLTRRRKRTNRRNARS